MLIELKQSLIHLSIEMARQFLLNQHHLLNSIQLQQLKELMDCLNQFRSELELLTHLDQFQTVFMLLQLVA